MLVIVLILHLKIVAIETIDLNTKTQIVVVATVVDIPTKVETTSPMVLPIDLT